MTPGRDIPKSVNLQLPGPQGSHLGDQIEVAIGVDDTDIVVQRGQRDQEVVNGPSVPKPAVVGEIALEPLRCEEDIIGGPEHFEARAQNGFEPVVVSGALGRIKLLEETDFAEVEGSIGINELI